MHPERRPAVETLVVVLAVLSAATGESCWGEYTSLPHPLAEASTGHIGTAGFCVGGVNATGPNLNILSIDVDNGFEWSVVGQIVKPLRGPATMVTLPALNILVYSYACHCSDSPTLQPSTDVFGFDIITNSMRFMPSNFVPRTHATLVTFRGQLVILGGKDASGNHVEVIESLQLAHSFVWLVRGATMPVPWCGCSGTSNFMTILLFGCTYCANGTAVGMYISFYPETDVWTAPQPMVLAETHVPGATIDYMSVSALTGPEGQSIVALYNPYLNQTLSFTGHDVSVRRNYSALLGIGPDIYLVGGRRIDTGKPTAAVDHVSIMPTFGVNLNLPTTTFPLGTPIVFTTDSPPECNPAGLYRLATTLQCNVQVEGTTDQPCAASVTFTPNQSYPRAFICQSYGVCTADEARMRPCVAPGGYNQSEDNCLWQSCCWDQATKRCYEYDRTTKETEDLAYWMPARTFVLSIPANDVPTPEPGSPPSGKAPVWVIYVSAAIAIVFILGVISYMRHRKHTMFPVDSENSPLIVNAGRQDHSPARGRGSPRASPDGTPIASGHEMDTGEEQEEETEEPAPAAISIGRYTVIRKLGEGGFGKVYLVSRQSDEAQFALKYIVSQGERGLQNALREFDMLRSLQNIPHMVPVVDMFMSMHKKAVCQEPVSPNAFMLPVAESDRSDQLATSPDVCFDNRARPSTPSDGRGTPGATCQTSDRVSGDRTPLNQRGYVCIVTKFFPEGDLKNFILQHAESKRTIPERHVRNIMTQILTFLVAIHTRRDVIVHRDIKPENVLVEEGGTRVVVTDFGLAEAHYVSTATSYGAHGATLHYAAPEMIGCMLESMGPAVDMWAAGCILYVLMTQRVDEDHDIRVMFVDAVDDDFVAIIRKEMVSLGYSHGLASIAEQCLRVSPHKRLSAKEALVMLEELENP